MMAQWLREAKWLAQVHQTSKEEVSASRTSHKVSYWNSYAVY